MKYLASVLIVVVIGLLAIIGFAYSGFYDVSASSRHGGFTHWLLSTTSHSSVERRSRDIEVPNLDEATLRLAGVNDFAAMCAGCHGAPGQEPEAAGLGLYPIPPDLAESAEHMTAAELFWVTKNGIKMTGMPAWGVTHDDASLWPVVAFMTMLPEMDAAAYQTLLSNASGAGHHAAGHDHGETKSIQSQAHDHQPAADTEKLDVAPDGHDHSSHSHSDPIPAKNEEAENDGHDHEH